ncbi:MAG: efflux RND transporter periplasmic adaptor subunit [Marinilabiliales bacterium]|nr:efflux RND transporter periplasmic adaptor subunit [Marinilabiliales bacterium]
MKKRWFIGFALLISLTACHSGSSPSNETQPEGKTPVTVCHVKIGSLSESVVLNATSQFLLKSAVKAVANGYLSEVHVRLGQQVSKGDRMFLLQSKEAKSLGNAVGKMDSLFRYDGKISVNAPGNGYILQLAYREGDYVQDGETLVTIGDRHSLVFLLELPYELKPYLPANRVVTLDLPDGTQMKGEVTSPIPVVDPVSQSQSYIIRVAGNHDIPENLIAKVSFLKEVRSQAMILPKEAILTNEIQSRFWLMKMINDSTAVSVALQKGIESGDSVEILSPDIRPEDRVLLTGNYGLPDTAKVAIEKE